MRLSDVNENVNLRIVKVNIANLNLKNYLFVLGFVRNTCINVIKKSIFNGPLIIGLRNYQLSISRDIADDIEVDFI